MKDRDTMRVLRDGPDKAKPDEVAIAIELHRQGYADASVRTSKRIGRYGDPIYFEWRGRTASGDARLTELQKKARRFRAWLLASISTLVLAVIGRLIFWAIAGQPQ